MPPEVAERWYDSLSIPAAMGVAALAATLLSTLLNVGFGFVRDWLAEKREVARERRAAARENAREKLADERAKATRLHSAEIQRSTAAHASKLETDRASHDERRKLLAALAGDIGELSYKLRLELRKVFESDAQTGDMDTKCKQWEDVRPVLETLASTCERNIVLLQPHGGRALVNALNERVVECASLDLKATRSREIAESFAEHIKQPQSDELPAIVAKAIDVQQIRERLAASTDYERLEALYAVSANAFKGACDAASHAIGDSHALTNHIAKLLGWSDPPTQS